MANLHLLQERALNGQGEMELDLRLYHSLQKENGWLRFYEWSAPTISYGRFVPIDRYLDREMVRSAGFDLVSRPTAGGIYIHEIDQPFSLFLGVGHPAYDRSLDNSYKKIQAAVAQSIKRVTGWQVTFWEKEPSHSENRRFCQLFPARFDPHIGGEKVAGGAQLHGKRGMIHQGIVTLTRTITSTVPSFLLDEELIDAWHRSPLPWSIERSAFQSHLFEELCRLT